MTARDLLNRLRWDPAFSSEGVLLAVIERAGGRPRTVEVGFAEVREILPAGVLLTDGTFLPYHRITAVRRRGELLWPDREEGALPGENDPGA